MTQGLGDTRERILDATLEVLARSGPRKLSLSDVAAEARVTRPTLYRWFPSKEILLASVALHEQGKYEAKLAEAVRKAPREQRLEAMLRAIVDFQKDYSLRRVAFVEPEWTLAEIARVMPVMIEGIVGFFSGDDSMARATAVTRVALSNMLIPEEDAELLFAALRVAAGL